jgi:hypothetical protein
MTKSMVTYSKNNGTLLATTEKVAEILEREMDFVIDDWMEMAEKQEDLMHIPLNFEERTGHLPQLLLDLIARLRLDAGTKHPSHSQHVITGISAGNRVIRCAMVVKESRLLQVCLFTTLSKSASQLDFITLLPDIVTIADEVDAQLKQQMLCYMAAKAV